MSKPDTGKTELVKASENDLLFKGSEEGVLASENAADDFFKQGFSEEKTIKVGDPALGGIEKYIGALVGPGVAIEMDPDEDTGEVRSIPTWIFHPLNTRTMKVNTAITHRVISPFQLNAAFTRMAAHAEKTGTTCIGGAWFVGKIAIQGGKRQLNNYRIFDKYVTGVTLIHAGEKNA
jgi:hypothetical protein